MNPVHVRRHHNQPQHTVDAFGNSNVGMVEHRRGVQDHLEDQHRDGRRPQCGDHGELDAHRQQDFNRMEPEAGGNVELKIGMMHAMEAPERRHRMEHHMLEIDSEIQCQYRDDEGDPGRYVENVEQAPAAFLRQQCQPDRDDRKGQPHDQRVDDDNAEIAAPAEKPRNFPPAPRRRHLPERHHQQDTEKEGHADEWLVRQY